MNDNPIITIVFFLVIIIIMVVGKLSQDRGYGTSPSTPEQKMQMHVDEMQRNDNEIRRREGRPLRDQKYYDNTVEEFKKY